MIEGRHFQSAAARQKTLADAIDKYVAEVLPHKKSRKTQDSLLPWWKERIGHVKLFQVTPELISECRQELATGTYMRARPQSKRTTVAPGQAPKRYARSPATADRYLGVLSPVFTVAVREWRWINVNPCRAVARLRGGRKRDKVLSADQRARLFAQTSKDPMLHAFVRTSLSVACRAGELKAVTWADVDLDHGMLLFRDPKNTEPRTAWLTPETKELFQRLAERPHESTDKVFVNASGRGKQYQYYELFRAACKAAGIEGFTFHGLRHSAATYLARAGATEQQLKLIGGWKSGAASRYVHLAATDTKSLVEKMNADTLAGSSTSESAK